ncbi:MAG: DUF115 domain-containing protein [Spirochaetaceae bacterium]|nr:MAG: DUF115 domain-containing protein [Spirochaetaceae bacterium]
MLEIRTARSGRPTALVDGTHIHSPYDPQSEARRFVSQSLSDQSPSIILLLGAGLGYLFEELQRSFPAARILVIFYSEAIRKAFGPTLSPDSFWHPGAGNTVLSFLRSRVHELEAEGLVTLEWPPSARIYPQASMEANQALHQFFREIRGTLVTTSALGRLWLRNSLYNFLAIEEIYPQTGSVSIPPVTVIAASGPTLQKGIDFLVSYRRKIELWALPSSLAFLLSRGLLPDTIFLTDPGYYAFSHLQCGKDHRLHLSMPLSAARGTWRIGARVSLLSQDTPFERILLGQAGITAPIVPALGTVSATALFVALRRRARVVVFAGLDFCYNDIFSHVRPNNFENWLVPKSNRLDSLHHQLFSLAAENSSGGGGGQRTNLALDTYAGWFAEAGRSAGNRIRRLHPSAVELPGIEEIGEAELEHLIRSEKGEAERPRELQRPLPGYPKRERRRQIAAAVLNDWILRTERSAAAIHSQRTLDPLTNDSDSLSLIYLCNAAELTEARRTLRLQGQEAAVRKASAVLENHRRFLQDLSQKISEIV